MRCLRRTSPFVRSGVYSASFLLFYSFFSSDYARRKLRSKEDQFFPGISPRTFEVADRFVAKLDVPLRHVALAADDTKLLATFRPFFNGETGQWYILGGTGEPLLVADPDKLREDLDRAKLTKATKVSTILFLFMLLFDKSLLSILLLNRFVFGRWRYLFRSFLQWFWPPSRLQTMSQRLYCTTTRCKYFEGSGQRIYGQHRMPAMARRRSERISGLSGQMQKLLTHERSRRPLKKWQTFQSKYPCILVGL